MTTREIKRKANIEKWKQEIMECRGSGKQVTAWCAEQGINPETYYYHERACLEEISENGTEPYGISQETEGVSSLVKFDPRKLPASGKSQKAGSPDCIPGIIIRHGETVITMPMGSTAETIAELVKALNRHA